MRKAFEAGPVHIFETDTGAVARAEIHVGESMVMTGDPFGGQSSPVGMAMVYVQIATPLTSEQYRPVPNRKTLRPIRCSAIARPASSIRSATNG